MSKKWFYKDNKRYIFASKKMPFLNTMFGMTSQMKKDVDNNLKKQKDFLTYNFVDFSGDKTLSFFDMSMGANIKPNKYYGEMFNRVSTLREYAELKGFTAPVFITITPPSYLKPLKQIKLSNNRIKMVDNPRFCGALDYVNLAREYESKKWTKFLTQRIFKDMKNKYNERLIYMRTYEPMIDGTPHIHIVAFLPPEYLERFTKLAKKYFRDTRFDIKTKFDNDIGGVVAYILKYILKSFSNSKTNQLSDVGYWYAYYQIRRFVTSRTLIPLKIYKLIKAKDDFKNLLEVTKQFKVGDLSYSVSFNSWKLDIRGHTISSTDYYISEITILKNDDYSDYASFQVIYQKSTDYTVFTIEHAKSVKPIKVFKHIDKSVKFDKSKEFNVYYDDRVFTFKIVNGELTKCVLIPSKLKDYELYRYFYSLDPDDLSTNLHHYGLVKNELIQRGLLDEQLQNINDYNTDFSTYNQTNQIQKIGS